MTGAEGGDLAAAITRRLQPAPFWDDLGCTLVEAAPGRSVVNVTVQARHGRSSNTGDGSAHGGFIAAVIDMTSSCALLSLLAPEEGRTTIDLSVHFLAPAYGTLRAEGNVRRRGGRTAVIDVEVTGSDGVLAAVGRTTFAILPPRKG